MSKRMEIDAKGDETGKYDKKIVCIFKTLFDCILSDLITFTTVIAIIGIGAVLHSPAME